MNQREDMCQQVLDPNGQIHYIVDHVRRPIKMCERTLSGQWSSVVMLEVMEQAGARDE